MFRRISVVLVLTCLLSGAAAHVALGVPTLQLYSPDAEYDMGSESWLTYANPFELQAAGARTPDWVEYVDSVTLLVAVPEDMWDPTAEVTISVITDNPDDQNPISPGSFYGDGQVVLTAGSDSEVPLEFGDPDDYCGGHSAPHGLYPTYFWPVALPMLDIGVEETVFDYDESFDPDDPYASGVDVGDQQYYNVAYQPYSSDFMLHFDLFGLAHNGLEKWTFAPYSHDAEAMAPEPSCLLLIGAGIAALAYKRRRGRR